MSYKMVFSDMDGTLLEKGNEISVENCRAIGRAVDKGVDFVLCTGRGVYGVEKFIDLLGLNCRNGYVICQNGGAIYDMRDMKLIYRKGFSPVDFAPVAAAAAKLDLEVYYYDDRLFMADRVTDRLKRYAETMHTDMTLLKDPLTYDGTFTKCMVSGENEKLLKLKAEIEPLVQDKMNLYFSSGVFLEFVEKTVDKGSALEETAKKAGVSLADTIAIGDSDNDLPMLLRAGLGVAVANSWQHVKDAADYVTEKTCEESAVAEVIEKFILNP